MSVFIIYWSDQYRIRDVSDVLSVTKVQLAALLYVSVICRVGHESRYSGGRNAQVYDYVTIYTDSP